MPLAFLQFIRDNNTLTRTSVPTHTSYRKDMKYALIISIKKYRIIDLINTKYRFRLAVVILIVQRPFKRFHFRYRDLNVQPKCSKLI